ncbi:hypothetical protein PHET_09594 [Paragonimus heterotremus]|uniref:Uncharacterized protein n=1 Tax=Paragonimus heterotremus TaxID=100268 RepID=A0A8J4SGS9_9TREM|nr:hypothetical protein PHET_09594 [Paragonimus heterotremus]
MLIRYGHVLHLELDQIGALRLLTCMRKRLTTCGLGFHVLNDKRSQVTEEITTTPDHLVARTSIGAAELGRFSFTFPLAEMTAPHASQETLSTATSQLSVAYGTPSTPGSFQFPVDSGSMMAVDGFRQPPHSICLGPTGTMLPSQQVASSNGHIPCSESGSGT